MVQEMFLHLLQGSARATYLLDFNFVHIASCFASLAAAEDDRLRTAKIPPRLMYSTRQNTQVISVFVVEFALV